MVVNDVRRKAIRKGNSTMAVGEEEMDKPNTISVKLRVKDGDGEEVNKPKVR